MIVSLDGRPIAGVGDLQRSLVGDLVGRSVEVTLERDGSLAEIDDHAGRAAGLTLACTIPRIREIVASQRNQTEETPDD